MKFTSPQPYEMKYYNKPKPIEQTSFDLSFTEDRSAFIVTVTQKTFDEMCNLAVAHNNGIKPKTPEELCEVINNMKHPLRTLQVKGGTQIDQIYIHPMFKEE